MKDNLQSLVEQSDTLLKKLWDWTEQYIERLITIGEAMEESGHPLKFGQELGMSNKEIRRARKLSGDPDRAREAFRRCLVRAMKADDAIAIEAVVAEYDRVTWKSGIGRM
jgi:hypothetical protein